MLIKLLFAFLFSFGNTSTSENSSFSLKSVQTTTVYICYSNTAKKYHYSKTCRGLSACKHDVRLVNITDAKTKYNRTLCGWED